MKDYHNGNHNRQSTANMFDITSSEFNFSKKPIKKGTNYRKFGDEVDSDYAWLLNLLNENIEHTKPPMKVAIQNEDDDNDEEDEDNDTDNKSEDLNDNDPQYHMFLKQLISNGKSYKLQVSQNDEDPSFLEYEGEYEYDPSTDISFEIDNNEDEMEDMQIDDMDKSNPHGKKGEILMKRNIKAEHMNNMTVDSCYQMFLEGSIPSEYGAFIYEGKRVNYEEKVTNSDSDTDSDMLIWDNVRDLSEVNKKQLEPAEKEPSLKEQLMHILKKPYNEKEYKKLSEYIEQERAVHRLLPLRNTTISSPLDGVTKSLLDDAPTCFQKKFEAVKEEKPKALNLMRMFLFWLKYLPNEKMFKPWLLEEFMEVLPNRKRSRFHMGR